MAELLNSLDRNVVLGMAQAAAAIALCFGVVMLCRRFAVHVERETVISLARGLVQMVAVGVVLALLLHGNLLIASLILLARPAPPPSPPRGVRRRSRTRCSSASTQSLRDQAS